MSVEIKDIEVKKFEIPNLLPYKEEKLSDFLEREWPEEEYLANALHAKINGKDKFCFRGKILDSFMNCEWINPHEIYPGNGIYYWPEPINSGDIGEVSKRWGISEDQYMDLIYINNNEGRGAVINQLRAWGF